MKRTITSAATLALAIALHAATVATTGDGRLTYTENVSNGDHIEIDFARCMANNLFTFSEVRLNGSVLNHTDSDNIGPFLISGHGWAGGNHLESGNRTAHTDKITVTADGLPLNLSGSSRTECTLLTIEVENTILLPPSTSAVFAIETVTYSVSGNSIEVNCHHEYKTDSAVKVERYYGMQSMFIGETEMLTPGGAYRKWTPTAQVSQFTKSSAPDFCLFVEHSANGYQAAWMDPEEGIGDRSMVDASDVVFIGNSYSKSYHKIIGNRPLKNGDSTEWHGVYSWFSKPVTDNARGGDGTFAYLGSMWGEDILITADSTGKVTVGDNFVTPTDGFGRDPEVCDVVLVYSGDTRRPTWNAEHLRPYVTHRYADGSRDWFYDSFLFLEFGWNGSVLGNSGKGQKPALQSDWLEYLDHLFAKGQDLHALDDLIESYKAELGEPRMPHKVIIGIPAPAKDGTDGDPVWSDIGWGSIGGTSMNFTLRAHREQAVKWFIDELAARFYSEDFKNIDLAGFYWIEESLYTNSDIVPAVNRYIRDWGLRSYWIPYWANNDRYALKWRSVYRFDMAWRQPNYYFYDGDTLPPFSRLEEAIEKCRDNGMGLELEFETSGRNNGMHEVSADMHKRLVDYIDEFERLGVWDKAGVAHYCGTQGFYDMDRSDDLVNHATIDRLARLVAKRQMTYSGVGDIIADDAPALVVVGKGEIYISADDVTIYNVSGAAIARGAGRHACAGGIFIAADSKGNTEKFIVK